MVPVDNHSTSRVEQKDYKFKTSPSYIVKLNLETEHTHTHTPTHTAGKVYMHWKLM